MTTALVIAVIVAALVIAHLTARVNGLRRRCTEYGQTFVDNVIAANQMQEALDALARRNHELTEQSSEHWRIRRDLSEDCNRLTRESVALGAQFPFPTLAPDRGNDEPAAALIYDELVAS